MEIGRTAYSSSTDFYVMETEAEVSAVLQNASISEMIETSYPVYLSFTET